MTSKRGSLGHQSTPVIPLTRSNPRPLKVSQTGTISAGLMNSTGPSEAICASTIASGICWEIARAVGFSASKSGSTPDLRFTLLAFLLVGRPIEHAFFPDIEKSAKYQDYEEQHFE